MIKKVLPSLLLMVTVLALQAQRVTKKISLAKGQKLESVTQSATSMSMEMMGQQMELPSSTTATSSVEVKDVTDKAFLLTTTIKRIVLNSSAMGQEIHFDSDKPEDREGQLGAAFKNKIGVPQEIVVNRQGRITETDTSTAGDMVSGIMGSNIMIGLQYPLLTVLPEKAVKIGDSWADSSGTPETMKSANTYTLQKVTDNEALINFTGTLAKTGMMEQQGMQLTMNLVGTVKGTAVYYVNTGLLKNNSSETKMSGTMEIMGQSVPITGTITTTTTVNKQ